jgi:hypothetical protein
MNLWRQEMKASLLYRIASVLLLLFAIGHTLGFRQSDPSWGVDTLLGSMRSIHFDVQGFSRTYWDLFVAAGFSVGVFYLVRAFSYMSSASSGCSPQRPAHDHHKAVWSWPPVGAADAGPMQIQLWEGRELSRAQMVLGSKTHHPMRTEVG